MKQLTQNLRTGETSLREVPPPIIQPGHVLIQTHKSLISPGTENALIRFSMANPFQKARLAPDKFWFAYQKAKSNGLFPTIRNISQRLDQPIPLGYCNVGRVVEIGEGVEDIQIGDRVVSNGPHAEMVLVPRNLVAKIPSDVPEQTAVFTVMASIALNAIRLIAPSLGETVVVIGLGLIGMLTAELLKISGCNVIGMETNEERLNVAISRGFAALNPDLLNPEHYVADLTNGFGADAVIIATTSQSDQILSLATNISRKRGKIILIGTADLRLRRSDFYEKELTFQVSSSYGPGRYDPDYEQKGADYPQAYVRWTENRNLQAVLNLMSNGSFDPSYLTGEILPLADFRNAYAKLNDQKHIAVILDYPETCSATRSIPLFQRCFSGTKGVIGIVGAGHYTSATLLPLLKNASIKHIVSANGLSAASLAQKYHIAYFGTDYHDIINDPEVDLVIITTRHNLHSQMACEAIKAGKHVFVEKPMAIYENELNELVDVFQHENPANVSVTVGFNRRFSCHIQKMKNLLGDAQMNISVSVNAGFVPQNSWIHSREVGGGRILGEACHFIDLISFLAGSRIVSVCMNAMGQDPTETTDNAIITLKCENGSTGVVNYFSNGHIDYPKERVEVHACGRTLILDNFKTLRGYGFKHFSSFKTSQDKGHQKAFESLLDFVKTGGKPPVPFEEVINTTEASLAALKSLKQKTWINI
ncbi:bi-domain-containing oxidoreductase [Dyadobacter chenwenxiniae]|uniref:Bi-domain-containing oxidoreductase n=1 Tax=Dyadobacter chenwenxiniae TaxID=2906456 RepID=A0A9X1TL97_9BACT|nr:bi-domain-containing oxidoreductase [Dyadobacter chenwenxiniae]MCF0061993.1 bi-domain-containing oxidoreductase [Dyadobacter chenwenxiniae]UON81804.1 bi-domain-containing oxidoreductase [Dyadobacter chenwenxiniae]